MAGVVLVIEDEQPIIFVTGDPLCTPNTFPLVGQVCTVDGDYVRFAGLEPDATKLMKTLAGPPETTCNPCNNNMM